MGIKEAVTPAFLLFIALIFLIGQGAITLATTSGSNQSANLTIYDEIDLNVNLVKVSNSRIVFYANYTNSSNSIINVTLGNGACSVKFDFNGSFSPGVSMEFNNSAWVWQYNRTFNHKGTHTFQVNCTSDYGNLTLNGGGPAPSYTFPNNQNYVILINGNLNINEKIHVPSSSTVIFSAKGDIIVNETVGEISSSTSPTIEGLYSADRHFIAGAELNNCPTADLRLNIAGSVVANAGRTNGTFQNNRDLCAGNLANPSVTFIERPDFILNYPDLTKFNLRHWREVAP